MTTDSPKPRRRWLQFSLRTLLIVVTVFCVWLGITAKRAQDQRQAVEAIRNLGGRVLYDYQRPGVTGPFQRRPEWLQNLMHHDFFGRVVFVEFLGTRATNADLVHLEGLTKLKTLRLADTQVTDAGLEHLKGLTNSDGCSSTERRSPTRAWST